MITLNVFLNIDFEKEEKYLQLIDELVIESRKEAGNVYYAHFREVGREHSFSIIEEWRDQAAIDIHNETPHFQKFLAHVNDYLTQDLKIVRSEIVPDQK